MSVAHDTKNLTVQAQVSSQEWQARTDLAALYRLVAGHGWDDLVFTHISMRVPGEDEHFLINPYGLLFHEINASNLVKIDINGEIVMETDYFINPAGFTVHSPFHKASEDAHCIIHLHTDYGVAVASQKEGLLPMTQHALIVYNEIAYHEYEGIAVDTAECDRLLADMGDKTIMILRNHGTLSVGKTAADAYLRMFFLERACKMQILAQSGGTLLMQGQEMADKVGAQGAAAFQGPGGQMIWPSLLRKLDKEDSSFRD